MRALGACGVSSILTTPTMKQYWSITGWKNAPKGLPCIAFDKLDGSNIRVEWSKKRGWYKYGSRNVLMDASHETLGEAVSVFEKTLAERIDKVFRDTRGMPSFEKAIVFCEFHGPNSFAGQHVKSDPKTMTLFDVNFEKRGMVLPKDFINWFGNLVTPKVVYTGTFDESFIEDVKNGVYGEGEGVVVKGVDPKSKNPQHGLWMSKVKTNAWLERLKALAVGNAGMQKIYEENLQEQIRDGN